MNTLKEITNLIDYGYSVEEALNKVGATVFVAETLTLVNVPTSATGLTTGQVWSNAGVLTIV